MECLHKSIFIPIFISARPDAKPVTVIVTVYHLKKERTWSMGEINETMSTLGATDDFMIKQEQISS